MSTEFQKCTGCGCTEDNACGTKLGGACFWVDENFCSACALKSDNPKPEHFRAITATIASHEPNFFLFIQVCALMQLLKDKRLIADADIQRAMMKEIRKAAEPIEPPGTIIIPR